MPTPRRYLYIIFAIANFIAFSNAAQVEAAPPTTQSYEPPAENFFPQAVSSTAIWAVPTSHISRPFLPEANLTLHFASDPVVIRQEGVKKIPKNGRQLYNQLKLDIGMGIGFFDYLQLGVSIPVVFWEQSDRFTFPQSQGTIGGNLAPFAIANIRLDLKGRFFGYKGFGIGANLITFIPTPNQRFQAESAFRFRPSLIVDYESLGVLPFLVSGTIGWQFNPNKAFDYYIEEDALTWSLGGEVEVWRDKLAVLANVIGHAKVLSTQNRGIVSSELLAGARGFFGKTGLNATIGGGLGIASGYGTPSFRLLASIAYAPVVESYPSPRSFERLREEEAARLGHTKVVPIGDLDDDRDGIPNRLDACPRIPEDFDKFEDEDGCPEPDNDKDGILDFDDLCPLTPGIPDLEGCPFIDSDKDGIVDAEDACPDEPEDFDKFEDEDGCPEPDNDKDGIPDSQDKCPDDPETINGVADEDGCPDSGKSAVRIGDSRIEILERVYFDTGKASIKKRSFNLLDQVASILKARQDIKVLRVEGHTDDRGKDQLNLELSQQRAASVKDYLVKAGVAPERLSSRGYGESHPVDSNKTSKGRATNRRVEFHIIEREKKKK